MKASERVTKENHDSLEAKQQFLRSALNQDEFQNFFEFFTQEEDTKDSDINDLSLEFIRSFVARYKSHKQKQAGQQKHERSFALYQTANVQQAYQILTVINNSQNPQPQKPGQKSATDLLDSVFQASQNSTYSNSPTKNPPQNNLEIGSNNNNSLNNSPPENNNIQNRYKSNSVSFFENGNIWATTSNIQNPRKSAQFDNFWQFPTVNTPKSQFKTQNPSSITNNQKPQLINNYPPKKQDFLNNQPKKSQSYPTFEQLTKNISMSKKPNSHPILEVQKPSNMKKSEEPAANIIKPQTVSQQSNINQNRTQQSKPIQSAATSKQIKLISNKPLDKNNVMIEKKKFQLPSATVYKGKKVPYQGPTIHKSQFKDTIKCIIEAPMRAHVLQKNISIQFEKTKIIQRNFLVRDYVMYYIKIQPMNITIERNYQDFSKLRATLQKFYPGMQVPHLQKSGWFQTNEQNTKKQKRVLQFFLNDLLKNPEVKNSRILEDFITLKDHKSVKRKFQQYTNMIEFKGLQQLCVIGGEVNIVISQRQRRYHEHLGKLLDSMQDLLRRKSKLTQILGTQFSQVYSTLKSLSQLSTEISEQAKLFNERVQDNQIPSLQNTFNILSKSYEEWAKRINFESNIVSKRLTPFYEFQSQNLSTMRQLQNIEGSMYKNYMKRASNQNSNQNQSYADKNLSGFKTGILEQSKNLTVLKYQLGYMSNMLCKQSVRFFQQMSHNFKQKWIYKAGKYIERLNLDILFYKSIQGMVN